MAMHHNGTPTWIVSFVPPTKHLSSTLKAAISKQHNVEYIKAVHLNSWHYCRAAWQTLSAWKIDVDANHSADLKTTLG
jgi:hypothetical protein